MHPVLENKVRRVMHHSRVIRGRWGGRTDRLYCKGQTKESSVTAISSLPLHQEEHGHDPEQGSGHLLILKPPPGRVCSSTEALAPRGTGCGDNSRHLPVSRAWRKKESHLRIMFISFWGKVLQAAARKCSSSQPLNCNEGSEPETRSPPHAG